MKKFVAVILFLALFIRFSTAIWWEKRTDARADAHRSAADDGVPDGPFFFGDSDSYWKLGRALAFGRPYRFDPERNWTVFRMPGYPATLVPLFWLGGEHPPVFWGRAENVLFGVLTVFLTFCLGRYVTGDPRVGLLAAVFAAIDPSLAFQSALILSEEPYTAATLLQLLLLAAIYRGIVPSRAPLDKLPVPSGDDSEDQSVRARKSERVERFFGLGIALGGVTAACVYFRPSALDFLPFTAVFFLFWLLIRRLSARRGQKSDLRGNSGGLVKGVDFAGLGLAVLAAFLAFSLLMAPWALRNERVTGRAIVTTLQGGASLYDGLSPNATGRSDMAFVDRFRSEVAADNTGKPTERAHFEVRLDERLKREALVWAKANPSRVVRLAGIKFVRLWNFWPNEPSFRSLPVRLAIGASFGPILLFGLIGALMTLRRGFDYWLLWLPAAYITALHLIFVSSLRYRIPTVPALMILAAFALIQIYDSLKKRGKKSRILL